MTQRLAGRIATEPKVTAILGPTNTGKTHFAIERMLAHKSGMIGLPLRLLAREVYDKVARLKGAGQVALITGEEKIVPPQARFFVCTVEAMPLDIAVACLVVDEIQLCADPERGHVFTDRLLHARGEEETLFLGSETMRGPIQRFIPRAWFVTRPRFSDLAYTGHRKLTRLPRRSAVVGFSAEDVYGIAETVRRQRGGAAVVLGALSPRTRNAQVGLYQSGEVDFLIATDAIGLGLNMDVDHVAFAAHEKFDGRGFRPLTAAETGQIAGRAGRYRNDGTFGVTGECEAFEPDLVSRVENHHYDPVKLLQWRSGALDFASLSRLLESLEAPPPVIHGSARGLVRARPASDLLALRHLSQDSEIAARAAAPSSLRRLWDVCQLPDFRKLSAEEHARMIRTIFLFLAAQDHIPDDWMGRQIARLDVTEGDVATLSGRLAQIRTYSYAAHRAGWMRDSAHWQGQARAVEDRLSDALHDRLIQRFIDRRTTVLMKHLRGGEEDFALDESGGVTVAGESVGRLDGFRFAPDPRLGQSDGAIHGRTLRAAAGRGLEGALRTRARALADAPDRAVTLSEHGRLWWDGAIVGRLTAGVRPLAPVVTLVADDFLKGADRTMAQQRLDRWLAARLEASLSPLLALARAAAARPGAADAFQGPMAGAARGLAHRLAENFGALDRGDASLPEKPAALLRLLRPFGIRAGRRTVYLPRLIRPDAASLLALLWGVWTRQADLPAPPMPGLTSFALQDAPEGFLRAAGFASVGGRAIRFDMLERLEDELEKAATEGADAEAALPRLVSLLGAGNAEGQAVLAALGWKLVMVEGGAPVWRRAPVRPARKRPIRQDMAEALPDTPFAALRLRRAE